MISRPNPTVTRSLARRFGPVGACLALTLAACSSGAASSTPATTPPSSVASSVTTDEVSSSTESSSADTFFLADTVHTIAIEFADADYQSMLDAFEESGDKEWIEATVTIDGTRFERVGLRLKGNSSLMGLRQEGGESESPETLPWLIRLDKYVDDQEYLGDAEFVVRSNNSETSLNEAVALDLLQAAGLASQEAALARVTVNGGDEALRLVIENPNDDWDAANFATEGVLYKAESTGDYTYRGDDPAAYDEVFDQETDTDDEDLTPLIEFLAFIDDSDDATFGAELADHFDVEAFARYLAVQDLIDNFDDIDGPGNNSYLRYDEETGKFTVVAWDHNLAFGSGMGGMGGGFPGGTPPEGMEFPTDGTMPEGFEPPQGFEPPEGMELPTGEAPVGRDGAVGGPGGGRQRSNVLRDRFLADDSFAAMYEQALVDLRAELYAGGTATAILDEWVAALTNDASDLVDAATVEREASAIAEYFTAD